MLRDIILKKRLMATIIPIRFPLQDHCAAPLCSASDLDSSLATAVAAPRFFQALSPAEEYAGKRGVDSPSSQDRYQSTFMTAVCLLPPPGWRVPGISLLTADENTRNMGSSRFYAKSRLLFIASLAKTHRACRPYVTQYPAKFWAGWPNRPVGPAARFMPMY